MLNIIREFINLIATIEFQIGRGNVSLVEIVQLIFFIIITFIVASYLSRFLKYQGLKKVILDKGSRYIISNFISYSLGFFFLLIILQTTGFDISVLAVIGGGLGTGIGLGFQDFTKNFISGLTLLTERKIKTGDYVQIDELKGFVQEISTRAIVIKKKDGSSVIIPNSHFVERRITNFHYEAETIRLKIPIHVAYESDPTLVTEVLLLSAYQENSILQIPAPQVIFKSFGDSALCFELWVWVDCQQIGYREEILSSLYFTVEYKLRESNIKIPFPQRELWLHNTKSEFISEAQSKTLLPVSKPVQSPNAQQLKETKISIRDSLKKVPCFSHLNELRLRQVIEIGHLKSLSHEQILFKESDPGDAFYIILSGSVEVYAESLKQQLAILHAGDFFGEMALMLGVPRTATVVAKDSTLLFAIVQEKFKVLLQKHPGFHEIIIQELSHHQEELMQRKKTLQAQGLLTPEEEESNILNWVRHRISTLFNV